MFSIRSGLIRLFEETFALYAQMHRVGFGLVCSLLQEAVEVVEQAHQEVVKLVRPGEIRHTTQGRTPVCEAGSRTVMSSVQRAKKLSLGPEMVDLHCGVTVSTSQHWPLSILIQTIISVDLSR